MNINKLFIPENLKINGTWTLECEHVFSPEAVCFLHSLHNKFDKKRRALLSARTLTQKKLNNGWKPDFLKETANIRNSDWKTSPVPDNIKDRRVEITGPVDRKMIINALNSGAKVFMADFEDSNAPLWKNVLDGQVNLIDAVRKNIRFTHPKTGKTYLLNKDVATLFIRPRGLHLEEKHILIDNQPMSASLVDFGLYFFHNANELLKNGSGPYFYIPKLEHYLEARWWNEVFEFSQSYLSIPKGTIKATVLIETILASFQLNEILFELKDHSAGLNCGRWDYIFSYIKKFHQQEGFVLPNRDEVTMNTPFMKAYSNLVIKTCHKRGAHAIGGMAAQIPIKGDEKANQIAIQKVIDDKVREVTNGHDGTWVAHPALVEVAMKVFDKYMPTANQIELLREDVNVNAFDLIEPPYGRISEKGIRKNINVGLQYISAWLSGNGAAAIFNLMEDAATAEISRTQVWQWLKNKVHLEDGRLFSKELFEYFFNDELDNLKSQKTLNPIWKENLSLAADIFYRLVLDEELKEFLTTESYEYI